VTDGIELPGLDGGNPLGFLAALGTLDVLHRDGREPTLRWTDGIVPVPVVSGAQTAAELIAVLDADRARWRKSVVLTGPSGECPDDVKPVPDLLRRWAEAVAETIGDGRADADLFCALLSEGVVDGKGNGKPTHLHFTAGNQKFLVMVRELADRVDAERFGEALLGPWLENSPLPTLSWNSQGDRVYALRATDPSSEKRLGVPGADWLAFLGLAFFPTKIATAPGGKNVLRTSACDRDWKRSALRWPLWAVPLDRDTIWSLLGDRSLVGEKVAEDAQRRRNLAGTMRACGILRVMRASIRRSDQGGYGSFGGASVLVEGD